MKKLQHANLYGPVGNVFLAANTGSWRLERPKVNFAECTKCGTCARFCPVDIVTIDKDAEECVQFDWEFCKGCGVCANECPKKCIAMVPERSEA